MKIIKQYWLVLAIFLLVSLLVLARTFTHNSFRYDAVKWAEPSVVRSNLLTKDQLMALSGKKMVISLGNKATVSREFQDITTNLDPELILDKKNYSLIRRNKGPVILFSDETSVSAKAWMVLSETGLKNIYILMDKEKN